jgi:hypothetical protein
MPATSDRQRRAACADLERLKRGEALVTFQGMSRAELEKMCRHAVRKPKTRQR